jgi:hypothetical protein
MDQKITYTKSLFFGLLIIGLFGCLFLSQIPNTIAEESVSFGLTDRVGTGFGEKIEGDFTLKATGSAGIVRMAVYFNGEEVYNTTGNSISWRFSTKNYATGPTNITVIGWDNQGVAVQSSKNFEFLAPEMTIIFTVGVIAIAIVATILKYRYRARKQNPKQIKESVNINPDDL